MLYTKIQPKAFLVLEKKIFSVLSYIGMAAVLFVGAEPFEYIGNIILTDVKIWWKFLKRFKRREDIKKLHTFVHVYSPGARENNPRG